MRSTALLLSLLLAMAGTAPVTAATAASSQGADGYAGTNVTFETSNNTVVDYAVDGETMLESVTVQSQTAANTTVDVGVDADLSVLTNMTGTTVSVTSDTESGAVVSTGSGATVRAHDNSHGSMVVGAGGSDQYVVVNVSDSSEVDQRSDRRAVVTSSNGTQGTFIVVGNGSVTVNDGENVTADLENGAELVFRSYDDGRDQRDERQERLIANGTATAEVYVTGSARDGGNETTDVVTYGDDTAVEVTQTTDGAVTMTANRTTETGTIIIANVDERIVGSADDLEVTVDGAAAVEASSRADLESAFGSDTSKYSVENEGSADATANVLVAVNHFSERTVKMQGADGSDGGTDSDGRTGTGGNEPTATPGQSGFGAIVALLAVVALGLIGIRQRR